MAETNTRPRPTPRTQSTLAGPDGGVSEGSSTTLPALHQRSITRWFEAIDAACRDEAPAPSTFLGPLQEFREHVCTLRERRFGPRRIDPNASWVERPTHFAQETDEVVAFVTSGDRGDWSWELFFQMRGDGEVVGVWAAGFAACPFVTVRAVQNGRAVWIERGEILRNLRGPESETRQRVSLLVTERLLQVRIEERKNEVTYLDEAFVECAGRRIRPLSCVPGAPYCLDDGRYTRIEPGERITLQFRVPASWIGCHAALVATGHYRVRVTRPPVELR